MNLRDYARVLRKRVWVIGLSVLGGVAVAVGWRLIERPPYVATGAIEIPGIPVTQ